ncbi:MAG: hypothetical protein PF961_05865 [Planctomycetota bacterium]|nr:hypothetical protein [Planctomycetota bacterium]
MLVARARDRGLSWVIAMNSPEPDELNRAVQLSAIEGLELRIWVPHRRRSFHKYIIAGDGQAYRIDSFLRARRRHGRMTAAIAERLICPVSHRAFFRYSDSLRARSRAVDPDEVAQWHDILQEWERAAAERRAMGLDDDDYFT